MYEQEVIHPHDAWNHLKKEIDKKTHCIFVNEREICFVNLGKNIGCEQDGKNERFERPVVVFKKFWNRTFLGIPLTSKPKKGKFYFSFSLHDQISTAILSQIRLFDTKRIERKLWYIAKPDFIALKSQLQVLLGLSADTNKQNDLR